jgi:hypothetical protein
MRRNPKTRKNPTVNRRKSFSGIYPKKGLYEIDNKIMDELIQEHIVGRKTVTELAKSSITYKNGEKLALPKH